MGTIGCGVLQRVSVFSVDGHLPQSHPPSACRSDGHHQFRRVVFGCVRLCGNTFGVLPVPRSPRREEWSREPDGQCHTLADPCIPKLPPPPDCVRESRCRRAARRRGLMLVYRRREGWYLVKPDSNGSWSVAGLEGGCLEGIEADLGLLDQHEYAW